MQQPAVAVEQRTFDIPQQAAAFQQPAYSAFSANGQLEQQAAFLPADFQQGQAYGAPSLAAQAYAAPSLAAQPYAAQSYAAQQFVAQNVEAQPLALPNAAIAKQAIPAGAW